MPNGFAPIAPPAIHVDSITIRGFKSIAAVENLTLRPINVLIGANGSGKSNFVEVFGFLQAFVESRLSEYVNVGGGAEKFLHFGSKQTPALYFRICYSDGEGDWHTRFVPTADEDFHCNEVLPHVAFHSRSPWRIFHVHDTSASSPMRRRCKLDDNAFLRADGANLPAFLYLIQRMHPDSYQMIRKTVQLVAPFFEDFSLNPLNLAPDDIKLQWRHKGSDQYFDAASLSDGTLRFIALATLFLQPKALRSSLILVDEPELGLHPYAIQLLASMIKQAATDSQVIVSTQSPILLDHFAPEDVLVANRVGHATQIHRLESGPLADWLADYSLGQLWEKNELGGRPSPE